MAWENLPFPSLSSGLLHLFTCSRAGLCALDLKPGNPLGTQSRLPIVYNHHSSLCSSLSHLPRPTPIHLTLTSVRPQRYQASLWSYLAYLGIYSLRLSVLRVAKPSWCMCPKQAASALREWVPGHRAQKLTLRHWFSFPTT